MQNAVFPTLTAITVNVVHILCSLWFAFGMDMGIVGIAYASVIAMDGVGLSTLLLTMAKYRLLSPPSTGPKCWTSSPETFFVINRDIILRTFCIVAVYTFFTGASARMGDPALLAVNTCCCNCSRSSPTRTTASPTPPKRSRAASSGPATAYRCATACESASSGERWCRWSSWYLPHLVARSGKACSSSSAPNAGLIEELAGRYIVWIILIPIASAMPFIMDASWSGYRNARHARLDVLVHGGLLHAIYYACYPLIGNNALWLAFTLYMFLRGVIQYFMTRRLKTILDKVA